MRFAIDYDHNCGTFWTTLAAAVPELYERLDIEMDSVELTAEDLAILRWIPGWDESPLIEVDW